MTTTELFARLRTQLADAQRPGLAGVRVDAATLPAWQREAIGGDE